MHGRVGMSVYGLYSELNIVHSAYSGFEQQEQT